MICQDKYSDFLFIFNDNVAELGEAVVMRLLDHGTNRVLIIHQPDGPAKVVSPRRLLRKIIAEFSFLHNFRLQRRSQILPDLRTQIFIVAEPVRKYIVEQIYSLAE